MARHRTVDEVQRQRLLAQAGLRQQRGHRPEVVRAQQPALVRPPIDLGSPEHGPVGPQPAAGSVDHDDRSVARHLLRLEVESGRRQNLRRRKRRTVVPQHALDHDRPPRVAVQLDVGRPARPELPAVPTGAPAALTPRALRAHCRRGGRRPTSHADLAAGRRCIGCRCVAPSRTPEVARVASRTGGRGKGQYSLCLASD